MRTNIVAIAVESSFLMAFPPCDELPQDYTGEEADLQKETALDLVQNQLQRANGFPRQDIARTSPSQTDLESIT